MTISWPVAPRVLTFAGAAAELGAADKEFSLFAQNERA
jgi:hypothetical protein